MLGWSQVVPGDRVFPLGRRILVCERFYVGGRGVGVLCVKRVVLEEAEKLLLLAIVNKNAQVLSKCMLVDKV